MGTKMNTLKSLLKPYTGIALLFFILYSILGVVRHDHYGSFGADLGFIDQVFWRYSHFDFKGLIGGSHLEFTTFLLIPLYWIWSDPRMLIIFQALVISLSGIAVFLLARRRKLHISLCYVILLSYITFFGVQNALWFDVHTSVWGAAFFMWFIYFLDNGNKKASIIAFLLTIGSKENIAAYVFLFCVVYFISTRRKEALFFAISALLYLYLLFGIVFPATLPKGYGYSSGQGLVSGSPFQLFDTYKKQRTIFYTFAWVGFLPLLAPLYVLPVIGNLASYFILGREYVAAHEIFMHYRIDLAPLIAFATIFTIARYKWLNNRVVAIYLLLCVFVFQYILHLPLSYLAKKWFWTRQASVDTINKVIQYLPKDSSVVAQNNIYPHISQREDIWLLWPDERSFRLTESPCSKKNCPWFRWEKDAEYLIVDLSPDWDIRHLLQNREQFAEAVNGLEKVGIIKKYKEEGTTRLYTIEKAPK